jgi:hypothetical protein
VALAPNIFSLSSIHFMFESVEPRRMSTLRTVGIFQALALLRRTPLFTETLFDSSMARQRKGFRAQRNPGCFPHCALRVRQSSIPVLAEEISGFSSPIVSHNPLKKDLE